MLPPLVLPMYSGEESLTPEREPTAISKNNAFVSELCRSHDSSISRSKRGSSKRRQGGVGQIASPKETSIRIYHTRKRTANFFPSLPFHLLEASRRVVPIHRAGGGCSLVQVGHNLVRIVKGVLRAATRVHRVERRADG